MAKIRDLPLDRLVRGWLLDEKLRTSEDLWRAVGPRYQEGLDGVHEKTRIARDHLVHALGAAAAAEPKRRLTLGEGVAGVALLGLLALAGLRVAEALHAYPFPASSLTAEVDQVVIASENGLPAFYRLTGDDLRLAPRPRTAGGIPRISNAVGRYLLRPLPPGTLVRESDLGTGHDLAGRWIVTLPIDPSALGPQVTAGADALLILSPRDPVADPTVRRAVEAEALVLAIEKGTSAAPSGRVTLAIPAEARGDVVAALGSSEVFLARQGPAAVARTGRAHRNAIGVPSRP